MRRRSTLSTVVSTLFGLAAVVSLIGNAHADVLDDVKTNGTLKCGVTLASAGFSAENNAGKREGFDIDLCKAIAAAVLGDDTKIQLIPMDLKTAFAGLPTGAADVLTHRFTWTQSRDVGGLKFPKIMTMIVVTHEMGFARRVADRVVFMDQGQIIETASPDDFFDRPRSPRLQAFLGQLLAH